MAAFGSRPEACTARAEIEIILDKFSHRRKPLRLSLIISAPEISNSLVNPKCVAEGRRVLYNDPRWS